MSVKKFSVEFGLYSPSLHEQLKGFAIDANSLTCFENDRKAMLKLYYRNLITDKECLKIQKRLVKDIQKELNNG